MKGISHDKYTFILIEVQENTTPTVCAAYVGYVTG
jgi:hypothetical protein